MKTYKEWKALGMHVRKGEHHLKRNANGVPLFSQQQVDRDQPGRWAPAGSYYGASRSEMDFGDADYEGSMEEVLGGWDWYK
jgi:hypothetical protein